MGRLVEWELASEKSEKCDKCGMNVGATEDCCKTSEKQFKIESSYKASDHHFLLKASSIDLLFSGFLVDRQPVALSIIPEHPFSNAPPGTGNVPVFIRNCNFRI